MPFLCRSKNQLINQHYDKKNIHPEQFEPIIDPNLQALIEWVIYVGRWMPGQIGSYSRLVQTVWQVYKGYYQGRSNQELFMIAIAGLSRSNTKRFILRKFSSSFAHVFTSSKEWNKKPQTKYLVRTKPDQLTDIQAQEGPIKNYIFSQMAQKFGKHVADRAELKCGDNFSQIMTSAMLSMALQGKDPAVQVQNILQKKQKKFFFF